MKVVWLHNSSGPVGGGFLRDILQRLENEPGFNIEDVAIPVVRGPGALLEIARTRIGAPGVDLTHAQYGSLVGLIGMWRGRGRRVLSLRGSDVYWRYGGARQRLSAWTRVLCSWLAALRADAVVVMSAHMRDTMRRWPGTAAKPVHIVPDPAGAEFWPESVRSIAGGLRQTPFRVAIASLQTDNPVKRLAIVRDAAALATRAGLRLDLVELSGMSRTELRDALLGVDGLAIASTHEGWPNIVKEALLLRLPFVATAVSDLPALAGPGSPNRIVEPTAFDFAAAWVEQIAARLLDGQPGRELVAFHPDVVALKHVLLYRAYARSDP